MVSPPAQNQPRQAPSRMPFVLHALGFRLRSDPDAQDGSDAEATDPNSLVPYLEMPEWNVSHLATRTYSFRPLTLEDITPPPQTGEEVSAEEEANATPSASTEPQIQEQTQEQDQGKGQAQDGEKSKQPYIVEVPELSPERLNEIFPKFLINVRWNEITDLLLAKWKKREIRSWEFNEWKAMCKTIKKCPVFKNNEDKTAWKRAFINDAVMWILAIDFRWKFDDAEKIFKLLEVEQLSLIYRGGLFGLWIGEGAGASEKESLLVTVPTVPGS